MTRRYFDLAAPGYSFAEHARERGFLVALADHPGTGESSAPADGWALTPQTVANTEAFAAERLVASVPGAPACVIGVAHSAGASILIRHQSRRPNFDGLVLLGWAGRGLPEYLDERDRSLAGMLDGLDDAAVEEELVISTRRKYTDPLPVLGRGSSQLLVKSDLPEDVHQALVDARAPLLAIIGHACLIPGTAARAAASITVPLFLGVGEHDIATEHHTIPASFPASRDVTLFVLDGAGHNHNVEAGRARLWERVTDWAGRVSSDMASRRK
jgi:alpha-beta hydrolase superfamily lysophospholipase